MSEMTTGQKVGMAVLAVILVLAGILIVVFAIMTL